jgi:tetratricopeptide (TPR) repeat protein
MPPVLPRLVEVQLELPTSMLGWSRRSVRLASVGRVEEAARALERAVESDPALVHRALAWHYGGVRPLPEERLDMLRCPPGPSSTGASCWIALLMVGRGGDGAPDVAAALRAQARSVQAQLDSLGPFEIDPWAPDPPRARAQRIEGMLAWREGDVDRAYAQLDSALRRAGQSGRDSYTAFALADLQGELGDLSGAIATLRTQDLSFSTPFAHLRIAELQERLGNREEARQYYESALSAWRDADRDFPLKARAQEGLDRVSRD